MGFQRRDGAEAASRSRSPWRDVAIAVVALAALFGGVEGIEQRWLVGTARPDAVHALHLAKGLLGAVVVGLIVGLAMARRGRLAAPAHDAAPIPSNHEVQLATEMDHLRDRTELYRSYGRWLIRMRWVALVVGLILVIGATVVVPILHHDRFAPLAATLAFAGLANAALARRARIAARPLAGLRLQVALDMCVLTVLLQQSGGVENPLYMLYAIHVVIAGIVLPAREAMAVAAAATLLLFGLCFAELFHLTPHYEIALAPHPRQGEHVAHAALDPLFALGRAGAGAVTFHVLAGFVTLICRTLRRREGQLLEAADEVLASRRRLEGVIEASHAGIAVRNLDERVAWANHRYWEWLGVQKPTQRLEHADLPGEPADYTFRLPPIASSEGTSFTAELEATGIDGKVRSLLVSTTPIDGGDGPVAQCVQIAHDVSPLKSMQAQLVQAGKMAAVGEMAGRVSHEINNPAGIILAKAMLLRARELPPKVQIEVAKIAKLAERITSTVTRLLTFARPTVGPKSPDDLSRIALEAIDLARDGLERRGVEVEIVTARGPLPVVANAAEIIQVLLNLLNNAADAIERDGRVTITFGAIARDGQRYCRAEVRDTGPGIAERVRDQIFEPFFTTKPAGKGTGLGLAISQGLMRDHDGALTYVGGDSPGAVFEILLPEAQR